jgi:hypothetical protein
VTVEGTRGRHGLHTKTASFNTNKDKYVALEPDQERNIPQITHDARNPGNLGNMLKALHFFYAQDYLQTLKT